ncbi:MAG: hypothetical protein SWO11_02700 [Thermodesulfobacteriota bacterium]|nr:hypothetical protein [Thermodesulfobacteriota bacterium]
MKYTIDDPQKKREIEEQIKTKENWDYWNKIKKNTEGKIIIIDDTKQK